MSALPFYLVTLCHPSWDEALACARILPPEAMPELRLDLFPGLDLEEAIRTLRRRCLVTCRRVSDGGRWPDEDESGRQALMQAAAECKPIWMDWEWDLAVPDWLQEHRTHLRILRSVHVSPGVFDLEERLGQLPTGDAFKWVGHAGHLSDNARIKPILAWARDRQIPLSAFLMGAKGIASRCMQGAWGGSFTYAAPDDVPPAAPGQLPLGTMRSWRCHRLSPAFGLCGVFGSPVLHSRGPAFHNDRFQKAFKDLLYLPLECDGAEEAMEALESLEILGASLTMPLKDSLPTLMGVPGPLNTLWRRFPGFPFSVANTDSEALEYSLLELPKGPVLVLGSGGVAGSSRTVVEAMGRPCLTLSRRNPIPPQEVADFQPVGVIQATSLGMNPEDPLPFPEHLEAALPTLRWGMEWIYKEETVFCAWVRQGRLRLVEGSRLFELQALAQSKRFIEGCGG
ncbi:bifunctional type I 3-dehydroquinate dehydratase/shikimate dehydrogenase [Holophaga foetida]|uniref:bifunctional type I 3-dehydroquinate dehydratase/shikimate dehydrogenase n=1 Tax=Holophaga foetida TaxID=35839 RepID=UPI000247176E|nr:bifunctional type I 3-dehydroquinate dehydratase/shikimate dehydrogenase [Holophaga foetida]